MEKAGSSTRESRTIVIASPKHCSHIAHYLNHFRTHLKMHVALTSSSEKVCCCSARPTRTGKHTQSETPAQRSPPYLQKSPMYLQKSRIYPQKSPIYLQMSPMYLQKSPIYPQKPESPMYPQKGPPYLQKSRIYPQKSHIHPQKSPMPRPLTWRRCVNFQSLLIKIRGVTFNIVVGGGALTQLSMRQ